MITLMRPKNKPLSQETYDEAVKLASDNIHCLKCPCGRTGCLSLYGHYFRHLKTGSDIIKLRIQRLFCSACEGTHALLVSDIVPYSQIPSDIQASIASFVDAGMNLITILDRLPSMNERNLWYIVSRYRKHWQQIIRSFSIPFEPFSALIPAVFKAAGKQFMQIHVPRSLHNPLGTHLLFIPPT